VIGEAGVNHNGDLGMARKLVDAAAEAGADAVKFQTFSADATAAPDAALADYQARAAGAPESQHALLAGLELPREAYAELKARAEARGLVFLSTVFDEPSLALLEPLNLAAYKIPSGEIVNRRFLDAVGRKNHAVILSTGMARLGEIDRALCTLRASGCNEIALLHCVSCYPAPAEACNLAVLSVLARSFGVPVGFPTTPGEPPSRWRRSRGVRASWRSTSRSTAVCPGRIMPPAWNRENWRVSSATCVPSNPPSVSPRRRRKNASLRFPAK